MYIQFGVANVVLFETFRLVYRASTKQLTPSEWGSFHTILISTQNIHLYTPVANNFFINPNGTIGKCISKLVVCHWAKWSYSLKNICNMSVTKWLEWRWNLKHIPQLIKISDHKYGLDIISFCRHISSNDRQQLRLEFSEHTLIR